MRLRLFAILGLGLLSECIAPAWQPPDAIGLDVREIGNGGALRIGWSPRARQAAATLSGTLEIQDGAARRSLDLSPDQLGVGSLLYRRDSSAVFVCLKLNGAASSSAKECVLFISGPGLFADKKQAPGN